MIDLVARGEIEPRLERALRAPRRPAGAERLRGAVPMTIAAATHIGAVRLRVADVDALTTFYERAIGLRTLRARERPRTARRRGGAPLVELVAAPGAPPRPPVQHRAVPHGDPRARAAELARALRRVAERRAGA